MAMDLAERLKALRGDKSQAKFAELLGISQSSVAQYEKGRLPDAGVIESICTCLGVTADWLLFGKESDSAPASVPSKPTRGKTETPRPDVRDEYIACLRQLADLQKENGDLRVKVAQLETRNAELERQLAEALKPAQPAPMGGGMSKVG